MFNWLGNLFPYSDLHSLNLDWILSKMKETAAQAAKAVADAANALAQVAEAKAAALSAQTAAQDAQTAANKAAGNAASAAANAVQALNAAQRAQETATTANNKAQTAQETANTAQNAANTAQSAAETAQNTANTAQSAAQTAQNTANTAQSAAQTANDGVETLNAKFPIKSADIANRAIDPRKLTTDMSYLYLDTTSSTHMTFPENGKSTIEQITAGIAIDNDYFQRNLSTNFFQFQMKIYEDGSSTPDTIFTCITSPVTFKREFGVVAISPFIIVKSETNETYNGFIKLSKAQISGGTYQITCKAVFETNPPFNNNTGFVIELFPIGSILNSHI